MKIQDMFYDDINREINGVIKVDQGTEDIVKQEVEEYVITKELKKHFVTFFNSYERSFIEPTEKTAVWISGFFGSGKSHFLKILSYILENKEIDGKTTVERFRRKFEDDPATFMAIDNSTKTPAEVILFNIDVENQGVKDEMSVLRVFAKMFYKHLGYYGENFKIVRLEQFIERKGKTEEFKRVFEDKIMESWENSRDTFDFCEDEVAETLMEVIGMSETAARNWFNGEGFEDLSVASLVEEIKEYVDTKPKDYRLLFMVDEVGQFVGANIDLLLNLQSFVEKVGIKCLGKVWVMCTGQEAIDDIIKSREDEFSKIQARFPIRLSLSSSSADEVIQKRILKKTDEAERFLKKTYDEKRNEMANLFKFKDAVGDIQGYETAEEFAINFPFVPYQFIIMQKVFSEIRKHGNAGKHLSGGERSMLSGFQEAAQKLQKKDENAIVPFYLFYDTVHTFLDGTIRRVIERCENAVQARKGLEDGDEKTLKLLYMIRYINDIPAKLDNLVILLAEDIRVDKISQKKEISRSLDRLEKENYIARNGEVYVFLTDDEQDIEREIKKEFVEPSEITKAISEIIFGKMYNTKRFRYNKKYDFDFDKKVDKLYVGNPKGDMEIQILTMATSKLDKNDLKLTTGSVQKAICVLGESEYYNYLENAMKIKKYARRKNVTQLPRTMQEIIQRKQDEAENYLKNAEGQLEDAFKGAKFYIGGERADISGGKPKEKIDEALSRLVVTVYGELDKITDYAETDKDIIDMLSGKKDNGVIKGFECNRTAADEIDGYISMQHYEHRPTSMADVQTRFQAAPYGWREIDIAYVMARLIYEQKVTIKYGGVVVRPENKELPELLRKKSEIGKTKVSKREEIAGADARATREFLREFFGLQEVPKDGDGLRDCIVENFTELREHYKNLLNNYNGKNYPDEKEVIKSKGLISELLALDNDNIALVKKLLSMEDHLYDMQEDMENVEEFFKSQKSIFDNAVEFIKNLKNDRHYLTSDEVNNAFDKIELIVIENPKKEKYNYRDIPLLKGFVETISDEHENKLKAKKKSILTNVDQCLEIVCNEENGNPDVTRVIENLKDFYTIKKEEVKYQKSLVVLDSLESTLWNKKDITMKEIDSIKKAKLERDLKAAQTIKPNSGISDITTPVEEKKKIKKVHRALVFPAKVIESEKEIDEYIKEIRKNLMKEIKECDGIDIIN